MIAKLIIFHYSPSFLLTHMEDGSAMSAFWMKTISSFHLMMGFLRLLVSYDKKSLFEGSLKMLFIHECTCWPSCLYPFIDAHIRQKRSLRPHNPQGLYFWYEIKTQNLWIHFFCSSFFPLLLLATHYNNRFKIMKNSIPKKIFISAITFH